MNACARILALVLFLGTFGPPLQAQGQSAALDVAGLAALLGQRRETQARFVEERFVAGLDQPLRASGTLSFVPPSRFVRQTLLPRPELLAIDGNQVTMQRGGRTRTMTLDSVPEATALLEALRGALTGDLASLQRHYVVRVDGNAVRWRLSLSPRAERIGTQVQRLEIEGQGAELRSVELQLAGGDRSTMSIEPLVANLPGAAPAARK
ncbi:MAG: LolA-related protein [Gemmatimonas sp.]|jgi:hypothetical protein